MQCTSERNRLVETMAEEPVNAWLVLTRCAASLAIVVLLVALVVSDSRVMDGSIAQGAVSSRTAAAGESMEEHRRRVFVERQQRFKGNTGQRSVASEMAELSNQ